MSMTFASPSMRAAASDLAIAISPLGLVELSDEEFEMHGPRLNRYAEYWAWYLGHHWGTRREMGEPQLTFNYVKALAEYVNNFCFSRGISFDTIKEYDHITPALLKRIWQQDNSMKSIIWEMGQQGGVSGDCFAKVAYEPAWIDDAGNDHAGRVRILPLNSAFCFPTWHPHDRDRLLEFKLKYRFWGCVVQSTEALTRSGWKKHWELSEGEDILSLNPDTNAIEWQPVTAINVYDYAGHMVRWSNHINAVSTPNHRWLTESPSGVRSISRTEIGVEGDKSIKDLGRDHKIVVGGGIPLEFCDRAKYSDEFVETLAWYVCEGAIHVNQTGTRSIYLSQSLKNPDKLADIRRIAEYWKAAGGTFNEYAPKKDQVVEFYLGKGTKEALFEVSPNKEITTEFITSLTYHQAQLFRKVLLDADGCRTHGSKSTTRWTQLDGPRKDAYQMICAMLGIRSNLTSCGEKVQEYAKSDITVKATRETAERVYLDDGKIWCPTVPNGIWMARNEGSTFWTGNTNTEGTRSIYTYTELIRSDIIREYVNDELIDERENVLGVIPIVHIANQPASGSPWGISDVQDVVNLNRQYNETATDLTDIVNYHAAPVTVIIGAKPSQLEKGTNRVWSVGNKEVDIHNLENGVDLQWPLEVLNNIKVSMHEMTGVPETALGQSQPISNTSGVALAIQFFPLMQKFELKKIQYGKGIQKINELALKTLFIFEPEALLYNPDTEGIIKEGQPLVLDPSDPLVYFTDIDWPSPLPVDKLVLLNEIMGMMNMDLESRRGALKKLGEQFPDDKLQEIFDELHDDAVREGALRMLKTQIDSVIAEMTGMVPQPDGSSVPQETTEDANGNPIPPSGGPGEIGNVNLQALDGMASMQALQKLVVAAYDTKSGTRQLPTDDNN